MIGSARPILIKVLLALMVVLFDAPAASCVTLVEWFHKSTQGAQITTEFEGKPLAGAKLEIDREYRNPHAIAADRVVVLVTDDKGQAVLPRLHSGNYTVAGWSGVFLYGSIDLNISTKSATKPSHFMLELKKSSVPIAYEQKIIFYEQQPIQNVLSEFRGVINGYGDPIIDASIDVVLEGTQGNKHVTNLRSDHSGRFSAHLEDGNYLAFIYAAGWKESVVPVTIKKTENDGESKFEVKMQLGETY